MREVESLGTHFGTDSAILDLKHKISKGSIGKIEVPHIFERALVNLTQSPSSRYRTAKGVASRSS
jgi:hypothetical protein